MNNRSDEIEEVVKDLVLIVEKEVTAFQSLRDTLLDQKLSVSRNVEQHYTKRLKDLKEMLCILSRKFQNGQRDIRDRIELSIKFVDQCLGELSRDENKKDALFSSRHKVGQESLLLAHHSPSEKERGKLSQE